MYNQAFRKIEHYLYDYHYIDIKISTLKSNIKDAEYDQNYGKYIKNKSSSLEDLAIRNIELEQRIYKIKKWQNLLTKIIEEYRETNNLKYLVIVSKYFNRDNSIVIENKLNLSYKEQKELQNEILQYIYFAAIKNKILVKEVNY